MYASKLTVGISHKSYLKSWNFLCYDLAMQFSGGSFFII